MAGMQVFLTSCGGWHLPQTAKAFEAREALAGLWISDKNVTRISPEKFRRCWPFHLLMKPFYHFAPQIWTERAFYQFLPAWQKWFFSQSMPKFDVVQAIMGYATEPFTVAEKTAALKVVDCANSHPTTYFGYWQRECDLWCPGEKVPIPRRMFARMNRELERADLVIVQSQFCRESMVANGIPAEKVFINPMGVNSSVFKKREKLPEQIRFINVGTICLRKGHQYLFRAFQIVKKQLPAAELICVGNVKTDFRKEWPKWAGTFRHIEHMPHSELAGLLQSCTAFVFPSQEEGIARAQIEALATGLPVIGTHEGGTTTLVQDGVEGFIVRGRDPKQIAEAMIRVATDAALNQRMGEAAHLKGAARNTWQDYGDRLLSQYSIKLG